MFLDGIGTSLVGVGMMTDDVGVGGEVVGKGAGDVEASCVIFNPFLLIVDFFKLHGVRELVEGDTTTDKIDLLFILIFLSIIPRHHSQLAVLPP